AYRPRNDQEDVVHPIVHILGSRYFPSRQTSSAPRHTWNHVRAQGNAPEIPRRAIFLATVTGSGRDGDSLEVCPAGGGDYRRLVRGGLADKLQFLHYCGRLAPRVA